MVYVVERYLPGLTRSDLLRGLSRLEQAAKHGKNEVRYLGSTIVLEDEACFCQFEGPSEAAIAEANRRAGVPFDRIVPALTVNSHERRSPMQVSTSIPAPVQFGRARLFSLIAAVAAVVAVASWAIVSYAVDSGRQTGMTQAEKQYVNAIASLSPAELRAAFGTGQPASVLGSLTAKERQYVEGITALTPTQLRAAFGTSNATAFPWLTPKERQYVEAITAMTPLQLVAAYGTSYGQPSVLSLLTSKERQYVEAITAMTPQQLRAAFGTGN